MERGERIETLLVHGTKPKGQSVVPKVDRSATFRFETAKHGGDLFAGEEDGLIYARISNETADLLAKKVAILEGAEAGLALNCGMAAISNTALTLASANQNIVACATLYGGTFALFGKELRRFGIKTKFIKPSVVNNSDHIDSMIDANTAFLYIETPANPTLAILDISIWSKVAKKYGIPLIVDNTFATPYLQRPIDFGADIIIHSLTKYMNGHEDVIAGAVVGKKEYIDKIHESVIHTSGVLAPDVAYLVLRGMQTLSLRMDAHCDNAFHVVRYLERSEKVERIYYPGLTSHAGHRIAKKQMKNFGGIVAFEIKGGKKAAMKFIDSLELFYRCVSLGGVASMAQHPASMTHSTYSDKELKEAGISSSLIRLSVGIENIGNIITDLHQAFQKI